MGDDDDEFDEYSL